MRRSLVKVRPVIDTLSFTNRVERKSEKDGFDQEFQRQKKDDFQDESQKEASEEDVLSAVAQFEADQLSQKNGISASMEGGGPGLKVVLKDGTGTVIREFTGEEFLKLRETVSQEGRSSGKILDQKV